MTTKKETPPTIIHAGNVITLPETMTKEAAIDWLARQIEEDRRVVAVHEEIDTEPLDGAVAFTKAMAQMFGWTSPVPTPGFFGDNPPTMVAVETDVNETATITWGRFKLPGISGYVETSADKNRRGKRVFVIRGQVIQRDKAKVHELAELTRQLARDESIYKGKAFKVTFDGADVQGIGFLDVMGVDPQQLVLPRATQRIVDATLFAPIRYTEACRKAGVPLKRGVLLEGTYGTGKTLCAFVAARYARENGWTFIYLESVKDLSAAVTLAQRYQPAVIFAEDIDRAISGDERTTEMDEILNTIDGIDSKASEVMVILTTNHIELINKAMLRPGRLDAVVSVTPPDAPAVMRLLLQYGRGLIPHNAALEAVSLKLAGQIPAVIREVVERAKLAAVASTEGATIYTLSVDDLDVAADSMLQHLALMQREDKRPTEAAAMLEQLGRLLLPEIKEMPKMLESMDNTLCDIDDRTS